MESSESRWLLRTGDFTDNRALLSFYSEPVRDVGLDGCTVICSGH